MNNMALFFNFRIVLMPVGRLIDWTTERQAIMNRRSQQLRRNTIMKASIMLSH